jgi:glucokinase
VGLTIGVDVGGTKVLGGVVDPTGKVLDLYRRETPAEDTGRTDALIVEVIRELTSRHTIEAVGIGAAGWIDAARSTVLFAPHLAWRDEPLQERIAAQVNVPVVVENDANAAAWAEFRFGAACTSGDSMVLFTIGTGIGGGIVINGQLVRGVHGIAGELGHTLMVPDGYPCECGRRGCIEQYASGHALVRFAQHAANDDPSSAEVLLELAGGSAAAITGPMVTSAAQAGDPAALSAFNQVGSWLGLGLADIVQVLDPHVVVIGGGVIDAGELLLGPARASFHEALAQRDKLPVATICSGLLGNLAGLIGASDLARQS